MTSDSSSDLRAQLETGLTLPASWYSDPAVLRLEQERIFKRAWQYVGTAADVAEPGQFFACRTGGVPIVVLRDRELELCAFVNVCRHRGHEIAKGCGRRETLQCPYHAWTYGLDGSLRSAPRSDREPGFVGADWGLLPVLVDTWGHSCSSTRIPRRSRSSLLSATYLESWPNVGLIQTPSSFEDARAS